MRISDWSSDVCSSDLPSYLSRGALRGAPPDLTLGVGDNEIAQQLADAFGQNFDYTSVANGPSAVSTTFSGYAGVILSFNASQTAAADRDRKSTRLNSSH